MSTKAKVLHKVKRTLMHLRRRAYGMRAYIPGLREHHRLEAMVGPLGFWKELQHYHLHVLQANGLKPGHALLDIGCGPLQGGVAFIRYLSPGGYTGFDIEPSRIEAAQSQISRLRLADRKPRVFISQSFGDKELGSDTFDFMWASQILYYFNDEVMGGLLDIVRRRLRPGGKFLGDIFCLDHYEFKYPENVGKYVRHTPESLQAVAEKHGLNARYLGEIGKFQYPKRLSLRTNLLFEFTRKD